jgi:5-methylcytosine-specific restriction endonuclease McrA
MTLKLEGGRFGRLSTIAKIGSVNNRIIWSFKCDCGKVVELPGTLVVRGHTSSCGCLRIDRSREAVLSDISGRTFGRLTVIGRSGHSDGGRVQWLCRCECGKTINTSAKNLVNGTKVSCGCRKIAAGAANIQARIVDLVGMRFGKLVVTDIASAHKYGIKRWACLCDCGSTCIIRHGSLQSGRAISCGCARREAKSYMPAHALAKGIANFHRRRARKKSAGGVFTSGQIEALRIKQRSLCAGCGVKLGRSFHRDHIIALANGGSNDISNIQLLCRPCNLDKGALDPIEWAQRKGRLL